MLPNVVDKSEINPLSEEQINELQFFTILHCLSTPIERSRLAGILIEENPTEDYLGYWTAEFEIGPIPGVIEEVNAIIVLNRSFLGTLKELKETLSHEYGHHVTLSLLALGRNYEVLINRLPIDYYRLRGLEADYENIGIHYEHGWVNCDKEILAEDYRVLFTPSKRAHRMAKMTEENDVPRGGPSNSIRDWIWSLFKPSLLPMNGLIHWS